MIIERDLEFRGSKGCAVFRTLFDTGATYSCIRPQCAETIAIMESLPDPLDVETASQGNYLSGGPAAGLRIEQAARLDFYIDGLRLTDEFMVVPGLSEQAIIGATTLQKWKIKLDFEHDAVITDPRSAKLKLMAMKAEAEGVRN
jgi:predicted aspartyl protease